jgi:hypothetical protein
MTGNLGTAASIQLSGGCRRSKQAKSPYSTEPATLTLVALRITPSGSPHGPPTVVKSTLPLMEFLSLFYGFFMSLIFQ